MNIDLLAYPVVTPGAIVGNWKGSKAVRFTAAILDEVGARTPTLELFGGNGRFTLHSSAGERWWNDLDHGLYRLAIEIRDNAASLL